MAENEHVRDFLKYYCSLPKEPQYAVLLTGLWGSGKTWFIKDFIAKHLPQPERVLYLSLYGVQTFDDIESEFFRLLHPVLGSKPARILHRLARGVLKASLNFDLDGDGKSDGSVSGGIPAEKMLERISLDPSRILVLDDLERCSISTTDLLGYVNQFIEHGGVKAILIANEVELLKHDSGTDVGYARIKEKLIGRTFEVVPEVYAALDSFSTDLPTSRAQAVVRNNFTLVSQVYECSKYKNLRLLRHALWEYDRLTQSVDPIALSSDVLMADLLALFLSYSFEVHSGTVNTYDVKKLHNRGWSLFFKSKDIPDPDQYIHEIGSKYSGLNLNTSLITDQVWEAIFSTGSIPKSELNESLLKSKYFQSANQPNWVKLWHGIDLSDDDFSTALDQVDSDWRSRKYKVLGEVVHVTGLFVRYAQHGIYNKTVEQVIQSAKEYVDYLLASGNIPVTHANLRQSLIDNMAYAGLEFASLEDAQFRTLFEYVNVRRQEALKLSLPAQAEDLLKLIGTDTNLFFRRIILNNDSENVYYRTPILHLIPPDKFVGRLLNAVPEDRRTVAYAIKQRYSDQQFNDELMPELAWLGRVADLLRAEIALRAGKVSSLSLKWIIDPYFTDAISQLTQSISMSSS